MSTPRIRLRMVSSVGFMGAIIQRVGEPWRGALRTGHWSVAWLYARIDSARGVWRAPAGTEATRAGVYEPQYLMTDTENGVLNPLGLNCPPAFPIYGNVSWGARTLEGADDSASAWQDIPLRRFALFLEESLSRGTQWAVFEPNDEPCGGS